MEHSRDRDDENHRVVVELVKLAAELRRGLYWLRNSMEKLMTVQDAAVARLVAVDAKLDEVSAVLTNHTQVIIDLRTALAAAIAGQDFSAVQTALGTVEAHLATLTAASTGMVATDPAPAEPPAPEPAPVPAAA